VNLREWAGLVKAGAGRLPLELAKVVDFAGGDASEIARDMIGVKQDWWLTLADSTKQDKALLAKAGYNFTPPEYNPLLREGELKESFEWGANGLQAYLTSSDPVMFFHEYGTAAMPPRPVIGPAMLEAAAVAQTALGTIAKEILEP